LAGAAFFAVFPFFFVTLPPRRSRPPRWPPPSR
jgi:hypothetical protein